MRTVIPGCREAGCWLLVVGCWLLAGCCCASRAFAASLFLFSLRSSLLLLFGEVHDDVGLAFLLGTFVHRHHHVAGLFLLLHEWYGPSVFLVILLLVVGDYKAHLTIEIADGVENLPDDGDCLGTDVGEKEDGHQDEDGRQSRCANDILEELTAEKAMTAAGVEHLVAHDGREELGKGDRAPHHEDGEAQEPLQQVDVVVGMHHAQSHETQEDGNDEGRETKTACDEEMGDECSHRTARVLELLLGIEPFAGLQVEYEALVGLSCREERHKGRDHVNSHEYEDKPENEIEDIILENISHAKRLGESRRRLFFLFLLCHFYVLIANNLQK